MRGCGPGRKSAAVGLVWSDSQPPGLEEDAAPAAVFVVVVVSQGGAPGE